MIDIVIIWSHDCSEENRSKIVPLVEWLLGARAEEKDRKRLLCTSQNDGA